MQLRQTPKYQIYCARRVSAIFIWYVQYRNIRKPNNLKLFGSIKLKNLNKIVKIVQGHLYQREENYKIMHFDTTYCTLKMLKIIYTTIFRVKRFYKRGSRSIV
jgi:hypothetical protein